jgi:transcriptional regulator with XRE-family HTH domain
VAVRTRLQLVADRTAAAARRSVGEDFRRLREDAGLSKTAVAAVAGIDRTYIADVEDGRLGVSLETLNRVAAALNANVNMRVFPNTGPRVRDRFQAPMIEALLELASPSYARHPEVPVYRPVRGVIDLVLAVIALGRIVAIEAHSELRRLEQQLRWAAEKADALPSSSIWPALSPSGITPAISRILLLRSTRATHALARDFAATLAAAYPANPTDLVAALRDPVKPWPGNGLLWARVDHGRAVILEGAPRGVPRIGR